MVTLAALTIASAAASAATYPLVSIIPIALLGIFFSLPSQCFLLSGRGLLPACIGVDGSDDQGVHWWCAGEPVGGDRPLRHKDALADPAAEDVEGDHSRT